MLVPQPGLRTAAALAGRGIFWSSVMRVLVDLYTLCADGFRDRHQVIFGGIECDLAAARIYFFIYKAAVRGGDLHGAQRFAEDLFRRSPPPDIEQPFTFKC